MTEQEPSDVEEAADAADGEAEATDRLADIAAEPDGDLEARLADIAAEAVEAPTDEPSEALDEDLEPAFEPGDIEVGEALVDRVRETDAEAIAREIATLQLRVAALEGETQELREEAEDLESRLARKQADFQNYKKRQQERLEEEKRRATEDLVERLLDVRDNLARALDQDEGADIRDGVASTLRQFDDQLERENVERIEPSPGEATDPQRHEVLMRVESERPADTVAEVHRPGYEMAGKVLRAAQVTVSDGSLADAAGADGQQS